MRRSPANGVTRGWALTLRMVLVAVFTPVITIGAAVALVVVLPHHSAWLWLAVVFVAVGMIEAVRHPAQPPGRVLERSEEPELFGIVDRLCVVAELEPPEIVLSAEPGPNSWVVHPLRRRPRLYVTHALLDLLTPVELAAVLAHELSHVANRDAMVMTLVATPGAAMRQSMRIGSAYGAMLAAIGSLSSIGSSSLSRYREFAADHGSAMITGRPSALASALLKVSDSVQQLPTKDLRVAAELNAFNLVPVPGRRGRWFSSRFTDRFASTHPPLQARIDALHALERAAQAGS